MSGRIENAAALDALRERAKQNLELREGPQAVRITVHMGTCGIAAGGRDVLAALSASLLAAGVHGVTLTQAGCAGLCDREPMMTLTDAEGRRFRYGRLDARKVAEIVESHVVGGEPVRWLLLDG
jgi:(2Fe-2S) ferredoxin